MFDLRYHVASLAAVFVALIVGILVGVGLAGSGVTKEADLKAARLSATTTPDAAARAAQRSSWRELQKTQNAFQQAYPRGDARPPEGQALAVLYVGPVDGGVNKSIATRSRDAGAGPPVRVLSLSGPRRREGARQPAAGGAAVREVRRQRQAREPGQRARHGVQGGRCDAALEGARPPVDRRADRRREAAVDGVVVVRTAKPQPGDTMRFLRGLFTASRRPAIPVVGVEDTDTSSPP